MPAFAAHPLTPERWDDLVAVFGGGDGKGDAGACWCMWWRMPGGGMGRLGPKAEMKAAFRARVAAGPPPGLLGYDGGTAVGWVQVGPRADVPGWNVAGRVTAPADPGDADDPAAWGVSCFVVRAGHRRRGHAGRLLDAAVAHARLSGARTLSACPVEQGRSAGAFFHGPAALFAARGFEEVARRRANRPLVRLDLRGGS